MTSAARVCAIVLDHRRAALTGRCLDSLAGQVAHAIVVDNSAEAGASAELKRELARRAGSALPVTLVEPGRNLGFAAGVNFGLARVDATCDAVLVLNNDARLGAGAVARLQAALRAGGPCIVAPERTEAGDPLRLWYQRALGLVTRAPLPGSFPFLSGACLLVPRALAGTALFDEEFFMYGEDVELSWRLSRAGVALVTVPGAAIAHASGAVARARDAFYEHHVVRSHGVLARKLARHPAQALLFRACRAPVLLARAAWRAARARSLVPVAALARAWRAA